MGGGSADAAAMLRCARRLAPVREAAVASDRRRARGRRARPAAPGREPRHRRGGGRRSRCRRSAPYGVRGAAPAVRALDARRLPGGRPPRPAALRAPSWPALARAASRRAAGRPELLVNDLQPAALLAGSRDRRGAGAVREAGADQALVCGSGPTVIGLFWGVDGAARARTAASARPGRRSGGAGRRRGRSTGAEATERKSAICAGQRPPRVPRGRSASGIRHNQGSTREQSIDHLSGRRRAAA